MAIWGWKGRSYSATEEDERILAAKMTFEDDGGGRLDSQSIFV